MEKRKETTGIVARMLSAKEVCTYLGLGMNRGVEFAKAAGAERKVGRRCLYDKKVIDRALDNLEG